MPADLINKTKVLGKQFKCLVMERRDTVQYENVMEQNVIECYTDGSKVTEELVRVSTYNTRTALIQIKIFFFYLGRHSSVFQAEVFSITDAGNEKIK